LSLSDTLLRFAIEDITMCSATIRGEGWGVLGVLQHPGPQFWGGYNSGKFL